MGAFHSPHVFLLFPQSGRNDGWFQNTWSHDSKNLFAKIQGVGQLTPLPISIEDKAGAGSESEGEATLIKTSIKF